MYGRHTAIVDVYPYFVFHRNGTKTLGEEREEEKKEDWVLRNQKLTKSMKLIEQGCPVRRAASLFGMHSSVKSSALFRRLKAKKEGKKVRDLPGKIPF